ncbi:hypothetical protein [Agrococcus sp. Marseille-Q4369]|uniref:DUF7352 domain-containing protein n=1 Tax=Agrococcus sp. Marseille-Q4369 TaxID=2810513 RepID=UPI001B8ABA4F|nr:hypothetical protein [Agrococcus sp. Marseille-Q4369]QUW18859.1 hypothetical protein JSQ78_00285 [Agrococcus sp. Marseille-Q4369]
MRAIWKYQASLRTEPVKTFEMPAVANVKHVGMQAGLVTLWVEVDGSPVLGTEERTFMIVGTGHPIPDGTVYVGTTQDGGLVWHVYEVKVPA